MGKLKFVLVLNVSTTFASYCSVVRNSSFHSICSNLFAPFTLFIQFSSSQELCPLDKAPDKPHTNLKGKLYLDNSFNFNRDHQITKQTNKRKGK